jgi:hypothetical protein
MKAQQMTKYVILGGLERYWPKLWEELGKPIYTQKDIGTDTDDQLFPSMCIGGYPDPASTDHLREENAYTQRKLTDEEFKALKEKGFTDYDTASEAYSNASIAYQEAKTKMEQTKAHNAINDAYFATQKFLDDMDKQKKIAQAALKAFIGGDAVDLTPDVKAYIVAELMQRLVNTTLKRVSMLNRSPDLEKQKRGKAEIEYLLKLHLITDAEAKFALNPPSTSSRSIGLDDEDEPSVAINNKGLWWLKEKYSPKDGPFDLQQELASDILNDPLTPPEILRLADAYLRSIDIWKKGSMPVSSVPKIGGCGQMH